MPLIRSILLYILALFFILAGINHFLSPEIYLSIVPPYLPLKSTINYLSGAAEILGGILLLFPKTRTHGSTLIIMLLILFIPAHIYMIQIAPFHLGEIVVTPLIAWLRLPIQVLLICWTYWVGKQTKP